MGGGGGGAQAPSLNADQIGKDQTKANVGAAITQANLNNVNQITPYGNLTYTPSGGQMDYNGNWIPSFTATTTMSPSQQGLFDQSNAQKSGLFGLAQQYFPQASAALNQLPGPVTLPDTTAFQDQAYKALTSRSDIALNQQRDATQALDANQGVAAGSDAYNRSFQPINQARVDASNQATINAGTLADQLINRQITGANFNYAQAVQPLSMYANLVQQSQGGGPTNPTWASSVPTQVQAADVTSPQMAAFQAQNQMYQQQQQAAAAQSQGLMSGLFGLGGMALGGALGGPIGSSLGSSLFGMAGKAAGGGITRTGSTQSYG